MLAIFGLLPALGGTAGLIAPAVASPGSVDVYVGYADSLRPSPTNFPTPWAGSPTVVFEGCNPCTYDAGAVRVVNNTTLSQTINSVSVNVGGCVFSGWPSATLTPGQQLIVTQQVGGADNGCGNAPNGNGPIHMDSSDIGPGGAPWAGVCSQSGVIPSVDVTINGTTQAFTDSGQVLNTGGVDLAECPSGSTNNESTQWTTVGHAPCPGSSLTLAPASQTATIGSTATVTATLTNSCGQPLSGAAVTFTVLTGPNGGVTGSGVTDTSGNASFTYSSATGGTDTLQASTSNPAGTITSNTVTVTWTAPPFAAGGSFVIGDLENVSGGHVNWWGSQWWKNNALSTGSGPASFKGFEDGNTAPTCGSTWTTDPGNSTPPPASVPGLMAVIVTNHVTKSGSTISGNIVHIVVVRNDPGYAPNPGHDGTGTIVGIVC